MCALKSARVISVFIADGNTGIRTPFELCPPRRKVSNSLTPARDMHYRAEVEASPLVQT